MVDVPGTGVCHRSLDGEHAPFPRSVKHRLILFDLDFAEAIHAAHIVHAVHQRISLGFLGGPVPIMESRVMSSASFSSLQPSVPAGRIGNTRKRVSAVESQTRISMSVGNVMPKSARTPLGS